MASVTGLTLVKKFKYRGDTHEEFSNTYHFKQAVPSGDTAWLTLVNAAVAKEAACLDSSCTYTRAYGYDSDDPNAHHVFVKNWEIDGGGAIGSAPGPFTRPMAGDQAACVEWKTSRLSSRGKPIYLRKYFHAGWLDTTDWDKLASAYLAALNNFANLSTGMNSVGGGLRSRTHDETLISGAAIQWVTTRTLKRRGPRPRTGS